MEKYLILNHSITRGPPSSHAALAGNPTPIRVRGAKPPALPGDAYMRS
jgi:hypothetical protein